MSKLFHHGNGNSPRREIWLFHLIERAEKAKGDVSFRQWFPLGDFCTASRPPEPDPIVGRHTTCVCLISDSPRAKSWVTSRLSEGEIESQFSRCWIFILSLALGLLISLADKGRTNNLCPAPAFVNEFFRRWISQNGCWGRFLLVMTGIRVQTVENWKRVSTTDDVTYLE